MNCEKGDLVVVIKEPITCTCTSHGVCQSDIVGKTGRVLRLAAVGEFPGATRWGQQGEAEWVIESPIRYTAFCHCGQAAAYDLLAMSDNFIRPIRDPGDDAVDESKAWLPPVPLPTINPELIPSKEKA
jgi:hypothetical protein